MITYIIIGLGGSGKTTARKHLESLGFRGFEASKYAKCLMRANPDLNISEILRQYGRDIIAKKMLAEMDNPLCVISGFRTPEEIIYIKKERPSRVIFLETDIKTCYSRVQRRDDGRFLSFSEFLEKKINPDFDLGLMQAKGMADLIVENSGNMEEFIRSIESVCKVDE